MAALERERDEIRDKIDDALADGNDTTELRVDLEALKRTIERMKKKTPGGAGA